MLAVDKPTTKDLKAIEKILSQSTDKKEVNKYLRRISAEIAGQTKFNMRFWIAKESNGVLGVIGLADPLPKVLPLAETKNPGEMKILYVDEQHQRKGVGGRLVDFVENEAKRQGYSELTVRSAEKYKDTAWGLYDKLGYTRVGAVSGGEESKFMQVFSKILDLNKF